MELEWSAKWRDNSVVLGGEEEELRMERSGKSGRKTTLVENFSFMSFRSSMVRRIPGERSVGVPVGSQWVSLWEVS